MGNCPFNPSSSPCEIELALMILQEAERESMEFFYAVQEDLRYYRKRIQQLEAILTENGTPIPKDEN